MAAVEAAAWAGVAREGTEAAAMAAWAGVAREVTEAAAAEAVAAEVAAVVAAVEVIEENHSIHSQLINC